MADKEPKKTNTELLKCRSKETCNITKPKSISRWREESNVFYLTAKRSKKVNTTSSNRFLNKALK